MTDPELHLKELHLAWCEATATDPNALRYLLFERDFYEFDRMGFKASDMRLVVSLIKRNNARQRDPQMRRKLRIDLVIRDLARFNEDLIEAQRQERCKPTRQETALGELRGSIPERNGNSLKSVGDIIRKSILER